MNRIGGEIYQGLRVGVGLRVDEVLVLVEDVLLADVEDAWVDVEEMMLLEVVSVTVELELLAELLSELLLGLTPVVVVLVVSLVLALLVTGGSSSPSHVPQRVWQPSSMEQWSTLVPHQP